MSFYDPVESLAYCSGQCQASRYPPSMCRCPCGGRNHGILRGNRVIDVSPFPYQEMAQYSRFSEKEIPRLPVERLQLTARELGQSLDQNRAVDHFVTRPTSPATVQYTRGPSIRRRVGGLLKHSLVGYSESELNERILKGMRSQFNQDHVDIAIDQAYSVFYSKAPDLPRPELYELYETGLIDKALELMGKRWVIGRPKK
jgi:hypothetical protein